MNSKTHHKRAFRYIFDLQLIIPPLSFIECPYALFNMWTPPFPIFSSIFWGMTSLLSRWLLLKFFKGSLRFILSSIYPRKIVTEVGTRSFFALSNEDGNFRRSATCWVRTRSVIPLVVSRLLLLRRSVQITFPRPIYHIHLDPWDQQKRRRARPAWVPSRPPCKNLNEGGWLTDQRIMNKLCCCFLYFSNEYHTYFILEFKSPYKTQSLEFYSIV